MSTRLNLSQLKSCHQNWDAMQSCAGGKICGQCQEVIRDFRGMSDWEIALSHAQSERKVCGIYDPHRMPGQKPAEETAPPTSG